jgi:exonuclease-1
MVFDGKYLPSK